MDDGNLYIIKRTFKDVRKPTGDAFDVSLPLTFTDLASAKAAAISELIREGYEVDFFPVYDVNNGQADWSHGDGVMVYAEGPSHELLTVEIETVPNTGRFEGGEGGRVPPPLYHVLQTIIHYDVDPTGGRRTFVVEGTHRSRELALAQAKIVLLDPDLTKEDYAEYDEYLEGEGPFGQDVVVHAVKENGENLLVSVVPVEGV